MFYNDEQEEDSTIKKLEEFSNLKENENRLEMFRKYLFKDVSANQGFDLLDNIMSIINEHNPDEVRLVSDKNEEINDTLDCSKPDSINTSIYAESVNSGNKKEEKATYYRGIKVEKKQEYDYDEDSYIED